MTMQIPYDDAANKLYSYANVWYKWGGQSKAGIDCSGYVAEWWEDIGFRSEGFDTTADKLYDSYRLGDLKGTKLTKPEFGALVFYGSGLNAGHVTIGLSSKYIIGANGGSMATTTPEIAKSRYAFVKVQAYDYRADILGIWMPDYAFVHSVTVPVPIPDKTYTVSTRVNIRQDADTSAPSLGILDTGTKVTDLNVPRREADNLTWVHVHAAIGDGWVAAMYLKEVV